MRLPQGLHALLALGLLCLPAAAQVARPGFRSGFQFLGGGGIPAYWTPDVLRGNGLVAWWDAADTARIVVSSGNASSWTDKVGGAVASQATAANQPAYSSTALGGKPGFTFNGTTQSLSVTSMSQSTIYAVFAVAQFIALPASGGTAHILNCDNGNSPRISQYLRSSSGQLQSITFNSVGTAYTAVAGNLTAGAGTLMYAEASATAITAYMNGVPGSSVGVGGSSATATPPVDIASQFSYGARSNYANAIIGDEFIFSGPLTTSVRQKLEGYAAWKYGLQANLASSHPYRSRPPYVSDP